MNQLMPRKGGTKGHNGGGEFSQSRLKLPLFLPITLS